MIGILMVIVTGGGVAGAGTATGTAATARAGGPTVARVIEAVIVCRRAANTRGTSGSAAYSYTGL